MSMLHLFAVTGLIAQMLSGAASEPPDFKAALQFVLQRIVNPEQSFLGTSGTHNLVHYSCINSGKARHGFLAAGQECDGISVHVPVDRDNHAIILSVGKGRFALFQAESGSRSLILREFGRCGTDLLLERELSVDGLQDPAYAEHEIVLEVYHKGGFKVKAVRSGIHKGLEPQGASVVHRPSGYCPCSDCAKHQGSSSMIMLPMPPIYSSSSSGSAPSAPFLDSSCHH